MNSKLLERIRINSNEFILTRIELNPLAVEGHRMRPSGAFAKHGTKEPLEGRNLAPFYIPYLRSSTSERSPNSHLKKGAKVTKAHTILQIRFKNATKGDLVNTTSITSGMK